MRGTLDIGSNLQASPGVLNVGSGNLTLDNATVNVDLFGGNTADNIAVSGTASFTGLNTINISHWAVGGFDIITSSGVTGSVPANFKEVRIGDISNIYSTRMNAELSIAGNILHLTTSITNKDLTWNTDSGLWKYDSSLKHWFQNDAPAIDDFFHAQDTVYFTGSHSGAVTVDAAGIQVADMYVTGGEYLFTGGQITGQAVNDAGQPSYVREGALNISGSDARVYFNNTASFLNGITVYNNATLGGVGKLVGNVGIDSGGVISPGYQGIDTLTINGDVTFDDGTFFDVEVDPTNETRSDLLAVTGDITLSGATLRHIGLSDVDGYDPRGIWTVMTYGGSRTGEFAGVESMFAFLDARDIYDDANKKVQLELSRNSTHFNAFAHTFNQHQVANGLMSIDSSPLLHTILILPADTNFAGLYDELSGEIYASAHGALQNYDRSFAGALRGRAIGRDKTCEGSPLWVSFDGLATDTDATGNSAETKFRSTGVSLGAEKCFDDFLLGAAFRYGDGRLSADSRRSDIDTSSYYLGLYGNWNLLASDEGTLRATLGASYGYHELESSRRISHPALRQNLEADYDAHTAQVFGEVAYTVPLSPVFTLEPYAGAAWNSTWSEGFSENGGSAALRGRSQQNDNVSTSLGLGLTATPHERFKISAAAGWEHLYGDKEPEAELAFTGGERFTVQGAPLNRDALTLDLAAEVGLGQQVGLQFGYEGWLGEKSRSHGGYVQLKFEF